MPVTSASNGVRPEYRALQVIKLGVPVTPKTIDDHVGTGPYASKYVTFLRRDGFVFDTNKEGRSVISYTLTGEPENAEFFRNMQPKVKETKVKPEPEKKAKKVKAKTKSKKAKVKPEPKKKAKVGKRAELEEAIKKRNRDLIAKVAGLKPAKKPVKSPPKEPEENDLVSMEVDEDFRSVAHELVSAAGSKGPRLMEEVNA